MTTETTQEQLARLDAERQEHERCRRYLQAKECLQQMRQLTVAEGKRLDKEVTENAKRESPEEKQLMERHRQAMLQFTKLWEERLQQYDDEAEGAIHQLKTRQNREFKEQEELIRAQLAAKRPRMSKQVLRTRESLKKVVNMKYYDEAEMLKRQLEPLEAEELRKFDEQLSVSFGQRTKELKQKYLREMAALKQRISNGREELISQRKANFETLVQRHDNLKRELAQRQKTELSRKKSALSRQLEAVLNAPTKVSANYFNEEQFV